MRIRSDAERERLEKRLLRIEGQVRGVRRMVDEGRDCREVVQQISAVRAAVHQAGLEVMRVYAGQCLSGASGAESDRELIDYLIRTLGKWN